MSSRAAATAPSERSHLLPTAAPLEPSSPERKRGDSFGGARDQQRRGSATRLVLEQKLMMPAALLKEAQLGLVGTSRLDQGCFHLQDALDGISREHPIQGDRRAKWAYLLWVRLAHVFPVVATVYIALGIFEEPLWSRRLSPDGGPNLYHDESYPSWSVPIVPLWADRLLEFLCIALLGFENALQVISQGWGRFWRVPVQFAQGVFLSLALLDLFVSLFTTTHAWRGIQYVRAALLAVYWPPVLQQLDLARTAFPKFIAVLSLLVGYLFFCAWIATLVFPQVRPERTPRRPPRPVPAPSRDPGHG